MQPCAELKIAGWGQEVNGASAGRHAMTKAYRSRRQYGYRASQWAEGADRAPGVMVLIRIQPVCPSLCTLPPLNSSQESPSVSLKSCHHKNKPYFLFTTAVGLRNLAWHPVTRHTLHINWGNRSSQTNLLLLISLFTTHSSASVLPWH